MFAFNITSSIVIFDYCDCPAGDVLALFLYGKAPESRGRQTKASVLRGRHGGVCAGSRGVSPRGVLVLQELSCDLAA